MFKKVPATLNLILDSWPEQQTSDLLKVKKEYIGNNTSEGCCHKIFTFPLATVKIRAMNNPGVKSKKKMMVVTPLLRKVEMSPKTNPRERKLKPHAVRKESGKIIMLEL